VDLLERSGEVLGGRAKGGGSIKDALLDAEVETDGSGGGVISEKKKS